MTGTNIAQLMNDDFDPYIERLFKTVSVKVTQGQVSQEAYLRAMADSYDEKQLE